VLVRTIGNAEIPQDIELSTVEQTLLKWDEKT